MNIEARYRLNGVLFTIIVHMVIVLFFMLYKLGETRDKEEEIIKLELVEELKNMQDLLAQMPKSQFSEDYSFSQEAARNIAVNVSEKLNNEISTDKYIDELKQELGIGELNQQLDRTLPEENEVIEVPEDEKKIEKKEEKKPEQFKGRTNVTYSLENRWHRRQYVPVYKCQSGGTVVVDVVVDQVGNVVSAIYSNASNTKDECLVEEAVSSAYKFLFNADSKADNKQKGVISFQFISQR